MHKATRSAQLETAQEVASARSGGSDAQESKRQRPRNPFKVPDDNEFFAMRDEEKRRREQEHLALQATRLYQRSNSSAAGRTSSYRHATKVTAAPISAEEEALGQLILSPDSNQVQEGLRDFIQQKREIFLAQLAIDTKKEELQRLETLEREEEENLRAKEAEINLFRDQFRSFLESDGKATMEARQAAETESKKRLEVVMQIKQVSSQTSSLRNEIAHHNEKLEECREYKEFLEHLTPKDWRKQHPLPEMYFKHPQQLLDIMTNLEEQNMFLIRHCQEAEEAVERYRMKFNEMMESRDGAITEMIDRRAKKEKELDEMIKRNDTYKVTGEFHCGNELGEEELNELREAIKEFHTLLGFDAAASNDTSSMLRRIESKMEDMTAKLEKISKTNPALLKELAQKKETERRNQERTEKNIREKMEQEEKTQRAIQLAMMPIKRRTGRPLMERTVPKKQQSREKREEALKRKLDQEKADADLLYGEIWD